MTIKQLRAALILIFLFLLYSNSFAFAFENTSYRIQALGEEFVGIVEDEYTDLFSNPAYIGKIKEKRIYGKFGSRYEASPFSIVYISNINNTGIFSENYVDRRESERGDERFVLDWQRWKKYSWKRRYEYNKTKNDLGLIYGKFSRNKCFGIRYDYKEETNYNINMNISRKCIIGISYQKYDIIGDGVKNYNSLNNVKCKKFLQFSLKFCIFQFLNLSGTGLQFLNLFPYPWWAPQGGGI